MKRFFLGILICGFVAMASAQDLYSYRGFTHPVSVVKYGGYFYLSNAGQDIDGAAADGFISRMKSDGSQEEVTLKYISKLRNPYGITVSQGVLYVCDGNCLSGFDLQTKKKVFTCTIDECRQLTAVTEAVNQKVYLAATDADAIFEVSLADKHYKRLATVSKPVGLLIADDKLYVSSRDSLTTADGTAPNGKIGYIDLSDKKYHNVVECGGCLPWGMALDGTRLYYADWVSATERQGLIRWIDLKNGKSGHLRLPDRLGQPTELLYDTRNNLFLIPALMDGKVYGALGFEISE